MQLKFSVLNIHAFERKEKIQIKDFYNIFFRDFVRNEIK